MTPTLTDGASVSVVDDHLEPASPVGRNVVDPKVNSSYPQLNAIDICNSGSIIDVIVSSNCCTIVSFACQDNNLTDLERNQYAFSFGFKQAPATSSHLTGKSLKYSYCY